MANAKSFAAPAQRYLTIVVALRREPSYTAPSLLDSSSLSRRGESSGELGSVMVFRPEDREQSAESAG